MGCDCTTEWEGGPGVFLGPVGPLCQVEPGLPPPGQEVGPPTRPGGPGPEADRDGPHVADGPASTEPEGPVHTPDGVGGQQTGRPLWSGLPTHSPDWDVGGQGLSEGEDHDGRERLTLVEGEAVGGSVRRSVGRVQRRGGGGDLRASSNIKTYTRGPA